MTVNLQLTPEQERDLIEGTKARNREVIRHVLVQAVETKVDDLVDQPEPVRAPGGSFQKKSERLIEHFRATGEGAVVVLDDEAVSRASIYADHL